ncbi:MAG: phosphoenolpyruvate--protein phosphotransferase [Desulfobacteraceae bacterium 4572_19]|nr:MAG: phosphoenolpyruvate--protein phosphotransferase [Desulfobacteraceae bacterium 4572_19]
MQKQSNKEVKFKAVGGSPGICIGKAYIVDRDGIEIIKKYHVSEEELYEEVNRFKHAVKNAKDELAGIIGGMSEELQQQVSILKTHMELFKDKMLYGKTLDMIEQEHINAEWALKKVITKLKMMFQGITDSYLRGRATDVMQVYDRIMKNLVGVKEIDISGIDKRVILIATDLSPADTSQIQLERIKGFVTAHGGKSSHTTIIAKTLGIPAVIGLANVTTLLKHDDFLIIDGNTGVVIVNPTERTLYKYEKKKLRYEDRMAKIVRAGHLPAKTLDGFSLKLMGNIELAEEIVLVRDNGGVGIGLFRTEFLYLNRKSLPDEEQLFEQYRDVAELMAPHPVTVRTLDINGDKAVSYVPADNEANPALGLRAIRFCLKKPNVFKTQLRAILRAAVFGEIKILFPMISSIDEIIATKQLLKEAIKSLKKDGINHNDNIQIGIMIEIPAAVVIADLFAEYVDFFSIGTNDLIQYTIAIDRGNRDVADLYQPFHPAVIRMLKQVVDVGKEKNVEVCMCGEMAGNIASIPLLLGLGFKELSMNPHSIPVIKDIIRKLNVSEAERFLEEALLKSTAMEVEMLIHNMFGEIIFEKESSGE